MSGNDNINADGLSEEHRKGISSSIGGWWDEMSEEKEGTNR